MTHTGLYLLGGAALLVVNTIGWLGSWCGLPGNWVIVAWTALAAYCFPPGEGSLGVGWSTVAVLFALALAGEIWAPRRRFENSAVMAGSLHPQAPHPPEGEAPAGKAPTGTGFAGGASRLEGTESSPGGEAPARSSQAASSSNIAGRTPRDEENRRLRRRAAVTMIGAALGSLVGSMLGVPILFFGSLVGAVLGAAVGALAGVWFAESPQAVKFAARVTPPAVARAARTFPEWGQLALGLLMQVVAALAYFG